MNTTGFYPRLQVDAAGTGVVSHAGGVLLTEMVRATGLDQLLTEALEPWHKPLAVHHLGKIVSDFGGQPRPRWGLPGRCLGAPRRARRIRSGGLGPDDLPRGGHPRRRR